jgi:hypothetical protein
MRRKTQDRIRLWFGLLAYGNRALLMAESAQFFLTRRNIEFQNRTHHFPPEVSSSVRD